MDENAFKIRSEALNNYKFPELKKQSFYSTGVDIYYPDFKFNIKSNFGQ
jgi:hypothetical protein